MTSMADCIARGMDFGEIDRARGTEALREYDQLLARYATSMNPAQAAAAAAADLKLATKKAARSRYHMVVNQMQSMRRLHDAIMTSRDPARVLTNLLAYTEGSGYTGESVDSLTRAYTSSINAGLSDVLNAIGTNVTGRSRNEVLLGDLIRELHAEKTGSPQAAKLAEAVRTQQQRMRRTLNAHGADIGDLADYGVSHAHDVARIRDAGLDKWSAEIAPRLDWTRIVDTATGKPFAAASGITPPPAVTQRFLSDVYENITTRGALNREPSLSIGGKALYNQRGDARVLHFKDGSAWLEYNKAFGTSDPFTALMNGLHGMGRDAALMRVLGPNPNSGLEFARQVAMKRASELKDGKMEERVSAQGKLAKTMLAHANGAANVPDNIAYARFFAGVRAVLTSMQLGSAVLSSVTDVATIIAAANTIGLNARNILSTSVKLMASQATRETAARMGYVAETLADVGGGSARFTGQTFGTGLTDRMAGFTLRATGLAHITDMRKIAFKMEFSGYLADNANLAFDAIDPPLLKALKARGVTASDWDLLRDPATRFRAPNGADFITPWHWANHQTAVPEVEAQGLAMRLQAVIEEQLEYAIPTASLEGRARLTGNTRPGSISGELLHSATSYKSFSLSLMLGQYWRFQNMPDGWTKAKYATKLSAMLIVMGGLAIQLKELAKGNDPRPMNEPKFWQAALFQGGGLGIFGDFFAAETSRTGGGIGEAVAGPVISAIGDVIAPVARNITALVKGDDTTVGRDAADLVRRNTPFFSSAWYARTAYSRLVADELQAFLDPEAEMAFRRAAKRLEKEYGTQSFIPRRGTNATLRAPDFSNIMGATE